MKIGIAGTGYVGLSMAVLLAQRHEVTAYDIDAKKVEQINQKISPIKDAEISAFLAEKQLHLKATTCAEEAYKDADFIIVATPTNYDDVKNHFDTSAVESVLKDALEMNQTALIVIKSTIPVGYVKRIRSLFHTDRILFSPEFLREGKALYDNLYPSRIVVGDETAEAKQFANLLQESALIEAPVILTQPSEAEAIKLFANTYLAMRVAFYNELDTYCELKQLNAKQIITGIGCDPRIGNHYNNPSFGYGGYCLPKDTKQLKANYDGVPNDIISAIVDANDTRKKHIADMILARKPKTVGIYLLTMKKGSDNFRKSAIQDVIAYIKKSTNVIIYEPAITADSFMKLEVYHDLAQFKEDSDVIVTNRMDEVLSDVADKVYTRDIYERDE